MCTRRCAPRSPRVPAPARPGSRYERRLRACSSRSACTARRLRTTAGRFTTTRSRSAICISFDTAEAGGSSHCSRRHARRGSALVARIEGARRGRAEARPAAAGADLRDRRAGHGRRRDPRRRHRRRGRAAGARAGDGRGRRVDDRTAGVPRSARSSRSSSKTSTSGPTSSSTRRSHCWRTWRTTSRRRRPSPMGSCGGTGSRSWRCSAASAADSTTERWSFPRSTRSGWPNGSFSGSRTRARRRPHSASPRQGRL